MAAVVNASDTALQSTSPRIVPVPLPSNVTADWGTQVTGTGKPANNADVTSTVLAAGTTVILMTSPQLFRSSSGAGGVLIGANGLEGRNPSGVQTFLIDPTTGAVTVRGLITGGSNIDITGQAKFNGAVSSSMSGTTDTYAVLANSSGGSKHGLGGSAGAAGGAGVVGIGGSNQFGLLGLTVGTSPSDVGVRAQALNAAAVALQVLGGKFQWGSHLYSAPSGSGSLWLRDDGSWSNPVTNASVHSALSISTGTGTATATFNSTNKPGANSTNTWVTMLLDGVLKKIPAWD